MPVFARERCCCGCSVVLGSQILAAVSAITAFCGCFTTFFSGYNWLVVVSQILYCFASICASALVFQAIRTRRGIFMSPIMLVSIINVVALLIVFVVCMITAFGGHTSINDQVNTMYAHPEWYPWFKTWIDGDNPPDWNFQPTLDAYAKSCGWTGSFSSFFLIVFGIWVFMVHFDCFRTLKGTEGYPTAQYHGNDNITVPIYPTYPAPHYDAAAAAATANTAPAYPGTPYDIPPSYTNTVTTTADETPVKVPLP